MRAILRFIRDLFKPVISETSPPKPANIEPTLPPILRGDKSKKIALVVGHGNGDSGAMGWNGVEEYKFNDSVATMVADAVSEHEIKIFHRTSSGIVGVASRVALWNPDISIELHCNAYNGVAHGCEVLCLDGDEKSGVLAHWFAADFCKTFNRKLRQGDGVKWLGKSDRGFTSLSAMAGVKQRMLVEPFFIDNKGEWIEPVEYAKFLTKWLKQV